jgi:hypothetical protein
MQARRRPLYMTCFRRGIPTASSMSRHDSFAFPAEPWRSTTQTAVSKYRQHGEKGNDDGHGFSGLRGCASNSIGHMRKASKLNILACLGLPMGFQSRQMGYSLGDSYDSTLMTLPPLPFNYLVNPSRSFQNKRC